MRNYFIFDGVDSRDFGVYISGQGTFNSPARVYDSYPVPGRDGDIIGYEKRLENAELAYPAFIYRDFNNNLARFRSFLLSRIGYKRLTDSYHPDEYRLAYHAGGVTVEATPRNNAGSFDIVFTVNPRRFLTSGETVSTFTASGSITNPTYFDAKPLLRVYGKGTLMIAGSAITISAADEYTDIDCEIEEAYKGTASCNDYVSVTGTEFPALHPGENGISLGSGISKVELTPRWWSV